MPGIDSSTAIKLISEIGTDITKWPTVKHFCSWLGLCPGTRISGGRRQSSRTSHNTNRAAIVLRMAANSLYRSGGVLGSHLRRMKVRMGSVEAITATAHKMARSIYYMMKERQDYVDLGDNYYDQLHKEKTLRYLKKKAASLGFTLSEVNSTTNCKSIT